MSTYEISKSSLLSLKAEILRKQQELAKVQKDNKVKIQNLKKSTPLDLRNKGVEQREARDISDEEINLLKQSRTALEAKAKLYDKLSKEAANMSEEEKEKHWQYLVRFDKKTADPMPNFSDDEDDKPQNSEDEACTEDYEPPKNPDEEWVEYVDCLGRTRTCLRKDLDYLKSKDADLRSSIDVKERGSQIIPEKDQEEPKELKETTEKTHEDDDDALSEQNELLSSDMRREILRRQWEKEEDALRDKRNIHYQDVLFDEARTHGVGYYGFAKDEEVREQQQEALRKLREETQAEQKKAQELKAQREKQLAERAKAARNRRRARMGLPPEEDEPVEPKKEDDEKPTITVSEAEKQKEKEKIAEEKRREKKRQQHIRPWDKGKEGVRSEHREYTQEEWVEKKRKERPTEFAPPTSFQKRQTGEKSEKDAPDVYEDKSLYFSTKKSGNGSKRGLNPYRRNAEPELRTPIVNEVSDEEDSSGRYEKSGGNDDSDSESDRGRGVEIAPPPTFDYYGPSGSKKRKMEKKKANIEDSITAGLNYLREQTEQKQKSHKRDNDMFIM